jgi:hypothetical protein
MKPGRPGTRRHEGEIRRSNWEQSIRGGHSSGRSAPNRKSRLQPSRKAELIDIATGQVKAARPRAAWCVSLTHSNAGMRKLRVRASCNVTGRLTERSSISVTALWPGGFDAASGALGSQAANLG